MEKLVELFRVKRCSGDITETADSVFLCLGHMLASHLLQPTRRLLCPLEVKETCVQDPIHIDLALRYRDDFGVGVQCPKYCLQSLNIIVGGEISLANQNDVGKFDLID